MESRLESESLLEKLNGNIVFEGGLTVLSTLTATPLAALLPVLSNSLANGRQQKRVEDALIEIDQILKSHEEAIKNLSDAQYKIINETILTILQTTHDEKINYLKQAIKNSVADDKIPITVATQISRILRDIAAEELNFIHEYFQYSQIVFDLEPENDDQVKIETTSSKGVLAFGLISMGLVVPCSSSIGGVGQYQFSPLVSKLLTIIKGSSEESVG